MGGDALKILVVEDDEALKRILRLPLSDAGFGIAEATTGGEALRILEHGSVDAVVLDLRLPDGLGGAVLDWLRQRSGAGHGEPAWVVISALDGQEAAQRYGPLGPCFLAKPFDPWALVGILKQLLSPRDAVEPS